ncbi:TetR family transcriptional regulator [Budviciaceae bacterium BWR-B9]|uniref:TetR family transcriptional regulator n=2 Tax=Budviciaceae TaxID=1903416 RepID=A0ABS1IVG9_9GAMM|nr:TetR family transcriptional regulator [Limnobaculum allomyrinae]MBV7693732.1 TetR family transcriptional regulator [Limnobaculum sp. M2-1]
MSYMAKDERRNAILDAAIKVALKDGFMNVTTRKVSAELGAATGIIHHHFSSTSELRREVFRQFTLQDHQAICDQIVEFAPPEQLFQLLDYSTSSPNDPVNKLWNDAWAEAVRDKALGEIYSDSMLMLHHEVVRIIESGCQGGFFHHDIGQESIEVKAWRLMSISFGTITISYINPSIMQPVSSAELLRNSIRHELGYQPD